MEISKLDLLKYYYYHRSRDIIRKMFNIPYRTGEFYHSQGKQDDMDRRKIDLIETANRSAAVAYYQDKNKAHGYIRPKQCDRITNTPCAWSKTHWSNDRCDKCGYVFPEWN